MFLAKSNHEVDGQAPCYAAVHAGEEQPVPPANCDLLRNTIAEFQMKAIL